jgi:hypothetical protein
MKARVVVAGVLAGLVVFAWGAVSHMALPLGEIGVAPLPNQEQVLGALEQNLGGRKLHPFPWYEDPARLEEAYRTRPHGIVAFTPAEAPFSMGRALAFEALSNVVCGVLAAFLFAAMAPALATVGTRLAFGALLGAFASLGIDFSYWNWYGFPSEYLAAQLVDQIVAWSLAALVLGWRLGKS